MRRPKPNWRAIKRHRSYTVDELARTIGVAKGTVRRWLKTGLGYLSDQKPALILGSDALAFKAAQKPRKQKCQRGELYCVKCRQPRAPYGNEVEIVNLNVGAVLLRGLCPVCSTLMHRRASARQLGDIEQHFEVSNPMALSSLTDTARALSNVHFEMERHTYGKASSGK